ncbi:DUF6279 family lipoprotein [Kangiella sp. TOML190]|uniref:DUF6279 family lipoprotein n=1 Tax=Kangiella sp. TOML190 TaxID=2931351 RepID=UPI00203E2813|nr:DUF6279 family lipoprotein [Kangiella sp. TOML190]
MKITRLGIILATVLLLQSCGLKFWYNRLDWLVSWQVDDFVELTSEQEDQLEALIRQKLQWHRSTQLPLYADLIDRLINDIRNNNLEAHYDTYRNSFIEFYHHLGAALADDLIEQIRQLSDQQVVELIRNLNDEASKQLKKYKKTKPKKRLAKLRDNIEDGYEDWVGSLTKEQESLIKDWVEQMQPTAELRFDYGNRWRVALDYALHARQTEQGQANLKELILEPQTLQTEELKQRYQLNRTLEKEFVLKLFSTITKKQKKRFINKLEDYKEDFIELHQED